MNYIWTNKHYKKQIHTHITETSEKRLQSISIFAYIYYIQSQWFIWTIIMSGQLYWMVELSGAEFGSITDNNSSKKKIFIFLNMKKGGKKHLNTTVIHEWNGDDDDDHIYLRYFFFILDRNECLKFHSFIHILSLLFSRFVCFRYISQHSTFDFDSVILFSVGWIIDDDGNNFLVHVIHHFINFCCCLLLMMVTFFHFFHFFFVWIFTMNGQWMFMLLFSEGIAPEKNFCRSIRMFVCWRARI